MPFVTVDRARVRYREEPGPRGAPVVVLLHMAGGSSVTWGPVAARLGRVARVLAPDFPGHGQSDRAPSPPPAGLVAHLAAFTFRFLDALAVPRAALVGHSMGGAVAMDAALQQPDRVTALGCVACAGHLQVPANLFETLRRSPSEFSERFTGTALAARTSEPGQLQARPIFPQAEADIVEADFRAVDGLNLLPRVGALRCRTVVMSGALDVITPPERGRELAAAIPGATFVFHASAGHLLPREDPPAVTDAITALLQSAVS